MAAEDASAISTLDRYLTHRHNLEKEILGLQSKQREVTEQQRQILEEARVEAAAIRESADRNAERILREASQQADSLIRDAAAKARQDADILLHEAEQAAKAQRQSAEAVYTEARQKTAKVEEALIARLRACEERESAVRKMAQEVADSQRSVGRDESLVDGKRSMLRAGIEALRRALDEVQV